MGIGTNIKRLRNRTKFSQQEIADELGIDRVTYSNWENEATCIKSQYIPKLAEIYGVDIQDLFSEDKSFLFTNNNFDNKDNSTGIIIFNISDKQTAVKLGEQIQKLLDKK